VDMPLIVPTASQAAPAELAALDVCQPRLTQRRLSI
jgi:hypothetical protein